MGLVQASLLIWKAIVCGVLRLINVIGHLALRDVRARNTLTFNSDILGYLNGSGLPSGAFFFHIG